MRITARARRPLPPGRSGQNRITAPRATPVLARRADHRRAAHRAGPPSPAFRPARSGPVRGATGSAPALARYAAHRRPAHRAGPPSPASGPVRSGPDHGAEGHACPRHRGLYLSSPGPQLTARARCPLPSARPGQHRDAAPGAALVLARCADHRRAAHRGGPMSGAFGPIWSGPDRGAGGCPCPRLVCGSPRGPGVPCLRPGPVSTRSGPVRRAGVRTCPRLSSPGPQLTARARCPLPSARPGPVSTGTHRRGPRLSTPGLRITGVRITA
ncbi:hypothetical protein LX15_005194, partial [Streptoalloteichus tenebrarius]|nr:hypothetical protein [Streptoalloteichus tenebrarius]